MLVTAPDDAFDTVIEETLGRVTTIMQDEFFNVYDKTGTGMTNYKPGFLDPAGVAKKTALALASKH